MEGLENQSEVEQILTVARELYSRLQETNLDPQERTLVEQDLVRIKETAERMGLDVGVLLENLDK